MDERARRFFDKNQIRPNQIKYLTHEERKTVVHLLDGRTPASNLPLKELLAALPEGEFLNIQKGVVVAAAQIGAISDLGVYTMSDGRTFQGRRRSLRAHRENRSLLENAPAHGAGRTPADFLVAQCAIFDRCPVAACLIELVLDESGGLIDFVFRYCNPEMEVMEGVPLEQMLGHTLREVFPRADHKKLIAYADVALNGTSRMARSYHFINGEPQKIYCYQPAEGFCICVVKKDTGAWAGT